MILDIRYHERAPEQIQQVRMTTVYTGADGSADPEIVVQFNYNRPQLNIPLATIKSMMVTND